MLDADERAACLDGREVLLTHREFNLLYKLLVCMEDKKERLDRDGTRPGQWPPKALTRAGPPAILSPDRPDGRREDAQDHLLIP